MEHNVEFIKRQYFQQMPIRSFTFSESLSSIQSSLWDTILAPKVHEYIPGTRYEYLFLRALITRLENEEIDDRILQRYTALLQNPPPIVPPTEDTIITYSLPTVGEIYIKEQPNLLVSGGTTGLRTWEASLLLSEHLLSLPLDGKRVLELGAGTGLSSILACKLGAKVLSTDGSEQVIQKLQDNFKLNDVKIDTRTLRWGDDEDVLTEEKWDFVVGADITYDVDVCASLAETYRLALRNGGMGILAATIRNEDTVQAFVRECGMCSFPQVADLELRGLRVQTLEKKSLEYLFCSSPLPMTMFEIVFEDRC